MSMQCYIERLSAAIQHDQSIHHDANDIRGAYIVSVGFKAATDT